MWAIRLAIISVLVLAFQASNQVWGFLKIAGASPDLRLILLFWVAQRRGPVVGMFFGFLSGLILDVYAVDHLGASALAGCVVGYLVGLAEEKTLHLEIFARLMLFSFASFAFEFLYLLVLRRGNWSLFLDNIHNSFIAVLYTVILGGFALFIFHQRLVNKNEP